MVVLLIPKKVWLRKPEDQFLLLNVILTLINYQSMAVFILETLYPSRRVTRLVPVFILETDNRTICKMFAESRPDG